MSFTIGSLFDGSGGFPLAASLAGGVPVWASEIEPYPIAVTRSRFPKMRHLGDISKINGAEIEPVDVITFGSPCQDLSVAGKRAGLKHEANGDEETTRSGLFMEAVRIIKEMRAATNGRYPTYALWENVPGAFSSNGGEDVRVVLEELIKIVEPTATVPPPDKNGWPYADCYMGDGWSLAYRVFDAQYWGVPQRRRRIHLIVDFTGGRAADILFEREGVRGYFAEGRTPWQGTASDAQRSVGADDSEGSYVICMATQQGGAEIRTDDKAPTVTAAAGMSGNNQPVVCCIDGDKIGKAERAGGSGLGIRPGDAMYTLTAKDVHGVCIPINDKATRYKGGGSTRNQDGAGNGFGVGADGDPAPTLTAGDHHAVLYAETYQKTTGPLMANSHPGSYSGQDAYTDMLVVGTEETPIVLDRAFYNQGVNAQYDPQLYTDGTCPTLVAKGPSAVCHKVQVRYIVRRLTPTECARLQGFADRWGDIDPKTELTDEEYAFWLDARNTHAAINEKAVKEYTKEQMIKWYNKLRTDSAEYKMWGNGIALPPALYCMQGIADTFMEVRSDG